LQQRLVKTGVQLMKHARYDWLLLAEGQLTRQRFASMLSKDRGASAAERLANQATRGTAQPAAVPLNHTNGDLRLMGERRLPYGSVQGRHTVVNEQDTRYLLPRNRPSSPQLSGEQSEKQRI
jgi:hypothetical protein